MRRKKLRPVNGWAIANADGYLYVGWWFTRVDAWAYHEQAKGCRTKGDYAVRVTVVPNGRRP